MKIEQIVLENFGPFSGKQTIDLRTSSNTPLVVIYAENGRGKTFLYRAIRWALYGRVTRDSKPIPENKLVNSLGLSRGDAQMSVTLHCVSNGERLEVIRTLPIDSQTRLPTSSKLTIVKEGQALTPSSSEDLVTARLDEGISRFFFFDGEMLKDYETLLDDESGDVQIVRNSIEAILGAPALSRLAKALDSVERTTMKQIDAASKADQNLQKLTSALSDAEDKVRGFTEEIDQIRDSASGFQKELRTVDEQLQNFDQTRELMGRIQAKVDEKQRHEDEAGRARDEIRLSLQTWEVGLTSVASKALDVIEPIRDEVFKSVSEREKLLNRLKNIEETSDSGTCSVCHQPVATDATAKLEVEMAQIQSKLLSIPVHDQGYLNQLIRVVNKARRASKIGEKATLEQKGRALESALQKVATLTNEIARLDELIGKVDQPAIQKLDDRRRELNNKIAIAQAALKGKNEQLTVARAEQEKCKRDLQEENKKNLKKGIASAGSLQTPIRVNTLSSLANRVISESYDEFVQKMRESVSDSANKIFKSLISDSGYKGLMINKNFGLSLLNEEERVVDLRSSGQSQVVAVSLILALHECAVRSGTLLMDTPFGRLDLKHRKNMMNYFTTELPQVVLLIQSGELDDDDLSEWASFTSRRYRLERGESTAETFVEEF